jgi:hypothetical protein
LIEKYDRKMEVKTYDLKKEEYSSMTEIKDNNLRNYTENYL